MNFDDLIAIYTNPDAFEIIEDETGTSESSTNLDTNQKSFCEAQVNQNVPMPQEEPLCASSRPMNPPNLKKTHFINISKIAKTNSTGLKKVLNFAGGTSNPLTLGSTIKTYSKQSKSKPVSEKNPEVFAEPTSILRKSTNEAVTLIPTSKESSSTTGQSTQVSGKNPEVLKQQVSHFAEPTMRASPLPTKFSPSSSKESSSNTEGSKHTQIRILKPRKVMEKKKIGEEILYELTKRKPKPNPKYFSHQSSNNKCKRKVTEIEETNAGQKKIKHCQESLKQCDYMEKLNLCPKINHSANLVESGKNKTLDQSKSIKIKSECAMKSVEIEAADDIKRSLQERNHPDKWQATSDAISQHAMQVQKQTSKTQSPFCKLKRPFAHRRALDLKTKVAIIEEVMEGNLKKKEIASKYDIPLSTMTCIVKNHQTILNHYKMVPVSRKRLSFNKGDRDNRLSETTSVSPVNEIQEKEGDVELRESRQRRSIDLFTKLSIIQEIDKKLLNKKEVAMKFCIPASTLTMIVKDRARIELNSKFQCFNRKKFKRSRHTEVEIGLLEFLSENITAGVQMTTTELCKKAKFLARELNIKNFKCEPSSSWIWRFKQRFNLTSEGFCDQNLTKQIQKWHNLNDPHRPSNQRVYCDFCQTMYIGLDKVERHIAKKHLT